MMGMFVTTSETSIFLSSQFTYKFILYSTKKGYVLILIFLYYHKPYFTNYEASRKLVHVFSSPSFLFCFFQVTAHSLNKQEFPLQPTSLL